MEGESAELLSEVSASNGQCEDDDSDNDNMVIDEPSPPKLRRISVNYGSDEEITESQTDSPTDNKPIQKVLNRAKPFNHSTQTRYQTRIQSDSLPVRKNSYSLREPPFATNTKISLLDLATKLSAADRRVNGKKATDKRSPVKSPTCSKSLVVSLKRKMQTLSAAEEEDKEKQEMGLPSTVISDQSYTVENGTPSKDCVRSPEMLQSNKYQVVKVDLFQETPEKKATSISSPQKVGNGINARSQIFLQDDKVRMLKRNLALNHKRQELHDQAKQRELDAIRQLEEHRAKEKERSRQQAIFHAKAIEFYNDAFRLMEFLNSDADDGYIADYLPRTKDRLPMWPLIANMTTKLPVESSGYSAVIEKAIEEGSSVKKVTPHDAVKHELEEKEAINALSDREYEAMMSSAVNQLLRAKIPKTARRAFEAAKYAAESGIKTILVSEEARREREASGFLPTPRNISSHVSQPVMNKTFVNVSTSPSLSGLIPVPVNLVPIQVIAPLGKPATLSLFSNTNTSVMPSPVQQSFPTVLSTHSINSNMEEKSNKEWRYTCQLCKYQTDNRSHYRRHIVTLHSDIKPFACYVCDREFSRSEKCKKHIVRQHPEVQYDPKRARSEKCKRHILRHHPEVQYDPKKARKQQDPSGLTVSDSVPSPIDLSSKSTDNHPPLSPNANGSDSSDMEEDQKSFSKKKSSTPTLTDKTTPSYTCPQCSSRFWSSWHLKRHMSEVHAPTRRMKCSVCLYATGRRHRLVSHMKKHQEFFCFHCNFSSLDLDEYRVHSRSCSEKWYSNSLVCNQCNVLYPNRKMLRLHMKKKHNSEVYFCEMCPHSSSSLEELEKHSDTHLEGNTEVQCVKCDKMFTQHAQLLEHTKKCKSDGIEDPNKPPEFNCNVCSFSCKLAGNLIDHKRLKHKSAGVPMSSANITGTSQNVTVIAPSSMPAPLRVINPVSIASSVPVNLSTVPIMSTIPLTGTIQVAVNPMSMNAIPVYTNQLSTQMVSTAPMPLSLTGNTSLQPQQQVVNHTLAAAAVQPKKRGRPRQLKPSSSTNADMFDDNTGGLKGHGSGTFTCPHCPDRPPFKYCGSYIKHMYKHQKAGTANRSSANAPIVRIKCPLSTCSEFFNTNRQVEKHLSKAHAIVIHKTEPAPEEEDVEVIDIDSKFSIKNEPTIEISEDERDEENPESEEEGGHEEEEEESYDEGDGDLEIVEDTVDDTVMDHDYASDYSDMEHSVLKIEDPCDDDIIAEESEVATEN